MNKVLLFLITIYQKGISPFFPSRCRFYPSCSEYSKEAIQTYGPLKGLYYSIKRLGKCHPFHPGGIDLVKD